MSGFPAQVFADGPTERQSATPQLLTSLISQAQQTLTISTPYFVPDYSVINALCATAHRGVTVTMIFPKRNDSFVVKATSQSYYEKMLTAGIIIYEFNKGLLHAKTLTIDEQVTLIDSTNMDLRSFDLNYENNILLYDRQTTAAVRKRQQDYIAESDRVSIETVKAWSIPKRIWNHLIATIGPLL